MAKVFLFHPPSIQKKNLVPKSIKANNFRICSYIIRNLNFILHKKFLMSKVKMFTGA